MTARKPDSPIVWLDVETTGLDPERDALLEVAWILPDGTERSFLVAPEDRRDARLTIEVATMHAMSGLLVDLEQGNGRVALLCEISEWFYADAMALGGRVSLGGFSPHFDLAWMRKRVDAREVLSHRVVDVSTLLRFLRECGAVLPEEHAPAHRALADARHAGHVWQAWLAESRIVTGTPSGPGGP